MIIGFIVNIYCISKGDYSCRVRLSVCLSAYLQNNSKSYGRILKTISGNIDNDIGNRGLDAWR